MINFRFHVLSLSAVFLALGVGLVLGTAARSTAPQGPAQAPLAPTDPAAPSSPGPAKTPASPEPGTDEEFAQRLAPLVLGDRLASQRVLLIGTEAGRPYVDGLAGMLSIAGARLVGRMEVADRFVEPAQAQELQALATRSAPQSVTLGSPPVTDGVGASAALLAAVLVAGPADAAPRVSPEERGSVLSAYDDLGYLTAGEITEPADVVVVVDGSGSGAGASGRAAGWLRALVEFDRAGSLVVIAGAPTRDAPATLVDTVRADPALSANVSTVDNVATPVGRLVAAWAVAEQSGGTVEHHSGGSG